MKKIFLLFLLTGFYFTAFSQVISGTVIDRETKEKVSFAAIYFSGTFVGTTSDSNGNFKLDVSKNAPMPLSVSCMGYYSATLSDYSADEPLTVLLSPMAIEVNEVLISGKSLVRKRRANLKLFKDQFLGTTENARNCEILNESDITFNYDSDRDTLKAYASKPIEIYNKALGYKISFYLDIFEFNRKNRIFIYKGNIIFNEDLTSDDTKKELYETQRRNTYMGSRKHFSRALWTNELESSGFEIVNPENRKLSYEDLVIHEIGKIKDSNVTLNKYIKYATNLKIFYKYNSSNVILLKPKVYFDINGYYDYAGINWEGEMAVKRIGDELPFEYEPY